MLNHAKTKVMYLLVDPPKISNKNGIVKQKLKFTPSG